ncbi:MAG: type II toxin-antitoxin system RelE/ParE family toxin [Gammaproteobacteria bacterium]
MKLKWTRQALHQLLDAQDYIARENPSAAKQVVNRIAATCRQLLDHPVMGRAGRITGTRELIVNRTPYFVIYAVVDDTVQILRVLHGKQDWPPKS